MSTEQKAQAHPIRKRMLIVSTAVLGLAVVAFVAWWCRNIGPARADRERVLRAERLRGVCYDLRQQEFTLDPSAVRQIKDVIAGAMRPSRRVILETKGCLLGAIVLEESTGRTTLHVFSDPRWLELAGRYYSLTEPEYLFIESILSPPATRNASNPASGP